MTDERVDPEMLAFTMSEHVHDFEEDPDAYLRGFVDELLSLEPGLRQHVSDLVIGELTEELHRRCAKDAALLVQEIDQDWSNDD